MAKFKIVFAELFVCLLIIITSIFPAVTRATENPNLSIRINNIEGGLLENDEQISGFIESELQKEATADFSISLDEAKLIASEESQRNVVIIFNWENIEHPEHIAYSLFNQPAFSNGNVQVVKMSDNIETIDGEFIHLALDNEKNYAYIVYSIELFDISSSDFIDMYGRMDDVESNHINFLIEGFDEPAEEPQVEVSEVPVEDNLDEEANEDFILPVLKKEFVPQAVLLGADSDAGVTSIDSFQTSLIFGTKEIAGKNVWVASRNTSGHPFVFRVSYSTSGIDKTPAGSYSIKIPKHILLDRNGEYADSFDIALLNENEVDENDRETEFVYREEGDYYIITNHIELSAAMSGYFEVYYATSKSTFNYIDMGGHDPFVATFDINGHHAEAAPINVFIDTTARITWTDKRYPTLYRQWQGSWGDTPGDANDYYYLSWEIKSYIAEPATQPYFFILEDTVTSEDGYVDVVGYRFSGQSTFSTTNIISEQTRDGYRYDYVLTRHKKSDFEVLSKYHVLNEIKAIVRPKDLIDEETFAVSQKEFGWERPYFIGLVGKHELFIRADGSYRSDNYGSTYYLGDLGLRRNTYTRYDMDDLRDGTVTSLDDFDYGTWVNAYNYAYTADGDLNNPDSYGKKEITTRLSMEDFYLSQDGGPESSRRLTQGDYDIYKLNYKIQSSKVTLNEDTLKFEETSSSPSNSDYANILIRLNGDNSTYLTAARINLSTGQVTNKHSVVEFVDLNGISFKPGVTGVAIEFTNKDYKTTIQMVPFLRLNNSNYVMEQVNQYDAIAIKGVAHAEILKNGDVIAEGYDQDKDFARIIQKDSHIVKKAISSYNDKKKRTFTITWRTDMQETWTFGVGENGYIEQANGTFYDLLPNGLFSNKDSVSIRTEKGYLPKSAFSVEQISNYNNTGRELLIVKVKDSAEWMTVYFDTIVDWDSIGDFGREVYNPIAYRTGNDKIKDGRNDDGGTILEKDLMTSLTPEDDGNRFIYSQAYYDIYAITAATSGLTKRVKTIDSDTFVYDTTTSPEHLYEYRLRYMALTNTQVKNIIFYDSLENYVTPDSKSSEWHGELQSINVNQLIEAGANPKVYLSAVENLNIDENNDLTNTEIWKPMSEFGSLSNAKAIAIDVSEREDGSDFVIDAGQSIAAYLIMKAPSSDDLPNISTIPVTYNNVYAKNTIIKENNEEIDFFIRHDYTSVDLYITGNLYLQKRSTDDKPIGGISFRLFGKSDYGNDIDMILESDNSGNIVFDRIEKGKYTLSEYKGTDDWIEDHTEYNVEITNNSATIINNEDYTDREFIVYNKPRAHADLVFKKIVSQGLSRSFKEDVYDPSTMTKYAVSLYDIGYDVDENNKTMGLTFGPATGTNFTSSSKSHNVNFDGEIVGSDAGVTDDDNPYRCIHHDSWEEIVYWNFVDPAVYSKCINNGCTHSVNMDLTKTILKSDNAIIELSGDGASVLSTQVLEEARYFAPDGVGGRNNKGWGASRVRAALNGHDELSNLNNATSSSIVYKSSEAFTEDNSIFATFPDILKLAIGKRKTLFDSNKSSFGLDDLKTSYDKLFLISPNEISETVSSSSYNHPLESEKAFARFLTNNYKVSQSLSNLDSNILAPYYASGNSGSFGMRSIDRWGDVICFSSGITTTSPTYRIGLSPLFSLSRDVKHINGNLNNFTFDDSTLDWISQIGGNQATPNVEFDNNLVPNVTFKLSGLSAYGNDINMIQSSNSDGIVEFKNIEEGTYTLQEIITQSGLRLSDDSYIVSVDENSILSTNLVKHDEDYIFENNPLNWTFKIRKIDAENGVGLQGAVVTVKGVSNYGTSVDLTITSDANGYFSFDNLEPGQYTFKEISAPENVDNQGHTGTGGTNVYGIDPVSRILTVTDDGFFTVSGLGKDNNNDVVMENTLVHPGTIKVYKHWEYVEGDELPEPAISISKVKPEEEQVYTLNFHAITGSFENGSKTNVFRFIKDGSLAMAKTGKIVEPTYDDSVFNKWSLDINGTLPFTTTSEFEAETDVYAQSCFTSGLRLAYMIYGIETDVDKNNKKMGLTFGPYFGSLPTSEYTHAHIPTGTTSKGNKHRCIHSDSWDEIISWNKVDPYVYEQCLEHNCTKSLLITPVGDSALWLNPNKTYNYKTCGDGNSLLGLGRSSSYNYDISEYVASGERVLTNWNWGLSNNRAVLNGIDTDNSDGIVTGSDTNAYKNNITTDKSLFASLPENLRNAIGDRTTKYDSVYSSFSTGNVKKTYDKLWLLSINEILDNTAIPSNYRHPNEGTQYPVFDAVFDGLNTEKDAVKLYGGYSQYGFTTRSILPRLNGSYNFIVPERKETGYYFSSSNNPSSLQLGFCFALSK